MRSETETQMSDGDAMGHRVQLGCKLVGRCEKVWERGSGEEGEAAAAK